MNATILSFPNIHKRAYSESDIEQYIELRQKISIFINRQEMLLDAMDNRLFSGVHNFKGPLEEKSYKKLLAFYNQPSVESWDDIRTMCIFYHITVADAWCEFDKNAQKIISENEPLQFPSKDTFMFCLSRMKAKIIISHSKYLSEYSDSMKELEIKNPGIKEAVERRLH